MPTPQRVFFSTDRARGCDPRSCAEEGALRGTSALGVNSVVHVTARK